METVYNERYRTEELYWGKIPSSMVYKALELLPPRKTLKVLDLGCGEGQDALFFARNGYEVTAFDLSSVGIEKASAQAKKLNLQINFSVNNIIDYKPTENYDLIFSSGVLQYVPLEKRPALIHSLKRHTNPGGLHVLHTFVEKPFIAPAPDAEGNEVLWKSGELATYYHDWRIEGFIEEYKDCMSSGVLHQHAHNRLFARNPLLQVGKL
jgi:tellurite methyltransferase